MAKARDSSIEIPGVASDIALTSQEIDAIEDQVSLQQVLMSLGQSSDMATVRLYRQGKAGEPDKFLKMFSPTEWLAYDLAGVLQDYGGGDYRIRVYNEKTRLLKNVPASIEEPRGGIKRQLEPLTSTPQPNNNDLLNAIGQLAITMQSATMAAIEKLAITLTPKPVESRADFFKELQLMKAIFEPAQKSDPMQAFMAAVTFLKENTPRDGETTGADVFMSLVEKFAPKLLGAMEMNAQAALPRQPASAPARAISPGPAVNVSATPLQTASDVPGAPAPDISREESEMNLRLKMSVGFLVAQAKAGNPVDTYADMILDNVGDDLHAQILTKTTQELSAFLAQYDPEVLKHSEWFAQLHAALLEMLTEQPEEGTTETIPGAASDTLP